MKQLPYSYSRGFCSSSLHPLYLQNPTSLSPWGKREASITIPNPSSLMTTSFHPRNGPSQPSSTRLKKRYLTLHSLLFSQGNCIVSLLSLLLQFLPHMELQLISSGMSSKILKEALLQQKEIEDEARDQNPHGSFFAVEEVPAKDEEEDVDDFDGFDETQSHFGVYEVGLIVKISFGC